MTTHTAKFLLVPTPAGILLALALALLGLVEQTPAAEDKSRLSLVPIYRVETANGTPQLVSQIPRVAAASKSNGATVAFLAVVSEGWPEGLVPVFGVEKNERFELRRRPLRGQENSTEPLFFALPPEEEADAVRIAGHWDCKARHEDGSRKLLAFELTVVDGQVAGRFDQNTEYRVAFITGGTFRSNRMELNVEYIQDRYILAGDWRDGKLIGAWRRADDSERGTWEATRSSSKRRFEPPAKAVPLYEWKRTADRARRYSVEPLLNESGWERGARPICRVWRK